MTTHYAVLGVEEDASEERIKQAFRQIAKDCHPDRTSDEAARERMTRASTAYSVLRSADTRAAYDKRLRSSRRRRVSKSASKPPAPCEACGAPCFPGTTRCWKCLLGNAVREEVDRQREALDAEREAEEAARAAGRVAKAAERAARSAREPTPDAQRAALDEKARLRAEAARRVRAELERDARAREAALNEQTKHVHETTDTHGYEDPIHAPDAEALFQAILSESALRAARGVQKNGVNVWLHITPNLKVEPRGDTVELAREVHKGLKQANRLLDRVRRWISG